MAITFTPAQRKAIETTAKKCVVVAGPGSGKSTVIVNRIAHLLRSTQTRPSDITVITFTNRAAREIEQRLESLLMEKGEVQMEHIGYAGTVHGFMLRVLRNHGHLIGWQDPQNIAVLDEQQADSFMVDVVLRMKFSKKLSIKAAKEAVAKWPDIPDGAKTDAELVAVEFYRQMFASNLVDFDAILRVGLLLLARLPQPDEGHVLWDEFQDSSAEEMEILRRFPVENKFVVGDFDQSLYGFRGGSPEHLLSLCGNPEWTVLPLAENFRCGSEICKFANKVIRQNVKRQPKLTISATGFEGSVISFKSPNEDLECKSLATAIHTSGTAPQDIAVLLRSNALVEFVAKQLTGYGVLVKTTENAPKPIDWQMAKQLIALHSNPDNDRLMYLFMVSTAGKKEADRARLKALTVYGSINSVTTKLRAQTQPSQMPVLLTKCGITTETIVRIQAAVAGLRDDASMAELQVAMEDESLHSKRTESPGVTVCTIHASKGLEWSDVYMPAFEQGVLPKTTKTADIEEERRCCFVAFTRAKNKLIVSYAESRKSLYHKGPAERTERSQFIEECNQ